MSQKFFCVGCGFANDCVASIKPKSCSKCGMNFAFAKYSSAPPPVTTVNQIVYQEPPRRAVKARYIEETVEEDEYFDLDIDSLKGSLRIETEKTGGRKLTIESALENPQEKVNLGIPVGPAKSREEILRELAASNDKHWNVGDGVELSD